MRPKSTRTTLRLGLWLLLIFATSSTVVPFSAFVGFIQSLSADAGFKGWFAGFWLASWFGVVKSWHAIEYAILTTLGWRAFTARTGWSIRSCAAAAWGCAVLFAASDEWHQTFVPGRGGNLLDVGIDTLGASAAVAIVLCGQRRRRKKISNTDGHTIPELDHIPCR